MEHFAGLDVSVRAGLPVGRDHAPHLDRRHRVPLDPGTGRGSSMTTVQDQR